MSEIPLIEDEQRAVDRLKALGGSTNILSFTDLGAVKRLIARGVFREVGVYGVAFASPGPAVQKTDSVPSQPTGITEPPPLPVVDGPQARSAELESAAGGVKWPSLQLQSRPKRKYRKRASRPDLQDRPALLWMWRWANALKALGGRAYLRDLRRSLNSHKHKRDSEAGLARLISFRYVRHSKEGRRPVLELLKYPKDLDPPKLKRKRRHPRRSRGRTEWFELLLDDKDRTDSWPLG